MKSPDEPSTTQWDTLYIEACLARIQAGDATARHDLFVGCRQRLEVLVRRMLRRRFPDVRRWEDTADVLQGVYMRLDQAVQKVSVSSARHFLCLASEHIRFELIDLARQLRSLKGVAAKHATPGMNGLPDPPDSEGVAELDWWQALHEEAGRLPEEEREAFALVWYGGMTVGEAAQMLGVSDSTVRRRLEAAKGRLFLKLGDDMPEGG